MIRWAKKRSDDSEQITSANSAGATAGTEFERRTMQQSLCTESIFYGNKACPEARQKIQKPKWLGLFAFVVTFVMCSAWAQAQPSAKISRIGYISGTGNATDQGPYVEALQQGLRELGYAAGKNIAIEYRGAEGDLDRIPSLVNDLVQLKVDVIVAPIPGVIRAAKQATNTIPIVIVTGIDPVASGWVASLARPGGNITGVVTLAQELNGKRLELLTEVVPRLTRVAVLWTEADRSAAINFKEYEAAAGALKIKLQSLETKREDPAIDAAFQTAVKARTGAFITITTATLFLKQKQIADLAVKNRLPTMFQGSTWVDAGGLMSYSTNDIDAFRRAATYVAKILKGAKPADLPVEQPTKYEMVVNLKTAKQIGLTIPQKVLARADRVIR
jgi:putative tryptophan/tyrosine transport system substrate-binding protein